MPEPTITVPFQEIINDFVANKVLDGDSPAVQWLPCRRDGRHSLLTIRVDFNENRKYVLKMPRHAGSLAHDAVKQEHANMQAILRIPEVSGKVPAPASLEMMRGIPVLVMPFIQSMEMPKYIDELTELGSFWPFFDQCVDFLLTVAQNTLTGARYTAQDTGFFLDNVTKPLELLARYFPEDAAGIDNYLQTVSAAKMSTVSTPTYFEHREFNPYNISIVDKRNIVVFDWEDGTPQGLPLMDFFNLAVVTFRLLGRTALYRSGQKPTLQFIARLPAYLDKLCAPLGIPRSSADYLFLIFLLRNTALFLHEKRLELEYSRSWWYFLKSGVTEDILMNFFYYEEVCNSSSLSEQ